MRLPSCVSTSPCAFRSRWLFLLPFAGAVALSCGQSDPDPAQPASAATSLPAALRAAYLQTRMKEASGDLAFVSHRSRPDTLLASNSAQGVDSVLDSQG